MTEHPVLSIGLCNTASSDLAIWLEPWAEEFCIPSRGELVLRVEADDEELALPQLEQTEDGLAIYAASGTRIRVVIDGIEQDSASASITPPGLGALSTREFIGVAFGGFPQARPSGQPYEVGHGWFTRVWERLIS